MLTAGAAHDPEVVPEIGSLDGGRQSGHHHEAGEGVRERIAQICELFMRGNQLLPTKYWNAHRTGDGTVLGTSDPLMVSGSGLSHQGCVAAGASHGKRARVRLLLKDLYGKGILYVLTIPDNLDGL